jgi:hypothetical protein
MCGSMCAKLFKLSVTQVNHETGVWGTELHTVNGVQQHIFVRAKLEIEVCS